MKSPDDTGRPGARWARLRFAIIGSLLASPPERGQLQAALEELAAKLWKHPATGRLVRFAVSSIERWYYKARSKQDPVGALQRRPRPDIGRFRRFPTKLRRALWAQYKGHPNWRYQLHADNLAALVERDSTLGPMPSYATIRRYMQAQGMVRRRRLRDTPGGRAAMARLEEREVRSWECPYVNGLWHLDFHTSKFIAIITATGDWLFPVVLAILDDCSRLVCHVQWYIEECTETLDHGLQQAIQKRGLSRGLMSDNGGPMIAEETQQGLEDFSVAHEFTLPMSPYQNGKQENFWSSLEGRLMQMLEGEENLTLELLNRATQAWVEMEYNRHFHSELGCSPLERYLKGPSVERPAPTSEHLRQAFRMEVRRTQRRSDGTISLEGRRYEVPSAYRHLREVWVRYARWDLGYVHMVDRRTKKALCRLFPLDKEANASGQRKLFEPVAGADPEIVPADVAPQKGRAPLLEKLLADYAATGLPPAYIPHDSSAAIKPAADPTSNTTNDDEKEEA